MNNAEALVTRLINSAIKGNDRAAKLVIESCGGLENLFLEPKFIPDPAARELLRQWQEGINEQVFGKRPNNKPDN